MLNNVLNRQRLKLLPVLNRFLRVVRVGPGERAQHVAQELRVRMRQAVYGFESLVQLPEFNLHFHFLLHV